MSVQIELKSFGLGGVAPYGWAPFGGNFGGGIIGHEFTMVGIFKFKSTWSLRKEKTRTFPNLPRLEWKEKEFWYQRRPDGSWEYKGETDKGDLYQSTPGSPTWAGFAQGITDPRSHVWIEFPGQPIKSDLHTRLYNDEQRGYIHTGANDIIKVKASNAYKKYETASKVRGQRDVNMLKMWWLIADEFAKKHRRLPVAALDRPGIALSGGSGKSGGGFDSLASGQSRRRILQFDLGIQGYASRFTATQVLESTDGKATISKFFSPGKPDNWCKNIPEKYLAFWRKQLNPANVWDQNFELEAEGIVDLEGKWNDNPLYTPRG